MVKKIKIQLGSVQETLLLPLMARAKDAQDRNPILSDKEAIKLIERLDVDQDKLLRNLTEIGILGLCYRASKIEEAIQTFLQKYPNGKILDIGAGLDTTYYRCDNGEALWYDLDMPDAMQLREQLLPPPNKRVTYIHKSMFDYSWIDDIGDISNGLFITIPGVLPYFKEEEVSTFLSTIASRLKGAEVMFDIISQFGKFFVDMRIKGAGMKAAHLQWGILEANKITYWSRHIELIRTLKIFENSAVQRAKSISTKIMMRANQAMDMTQLVHLRFR